MSLVPLFEQPAQCEGTVDVLVIPNLGEISPPGILNIDARVREIRDMLSTIATSIRQAYLFGHQQTLASGRSTEIDQISTNSNVFLSTVHDMQAKQQAGTYKLVLVCISLGSLIVKKALLVAKSSPTYRHLYDAVGGILFVGSIHDETHEDFGKLYRRCLALDISCLSEDNIPKSLKSVEAVEAVKIVCSEFRTLRSPWHIISFYEIRSTLMKSAFMKASLRTKDRIVVPSTVVVLDWENARVLPIDLDHRMMSAFKLSDFGFLSLHLMEVVRLCKSMVKESSFASRTVSIPVNRTVPNLNGRVVRPTSRNIKLQQTSQAGKLSTLKIPCHILRPYKRNPAFTGRLEVLNKIRTNLSPKDDKTFVQLKYALYGLGGMGKTQIALEYAFTSFSTFPVILWAQSDTRAKLTQSFAEFAYELGLVTSVTDNQGKCRELVKSTLESAVFNNADGVESLNLLDDFWPTSNRGSVLITTRNKEVLGQFTGEVDRLGKIEEEEAIELLVKLSHRESNKKDRSNALKICKRVDFLPLAILATALQIDQDESTFAEFLEESSTHELLKNNVSVHGPETRYRHTLSTVWEQNFKRLNNETSDFLNILAFLDPDGIQEKMILSGVQRSSDPRLEFIRVSKRVNEHRSQLCRSGLVERNSELGQLIMHRLVSDVCHFQMSDKLAQTGFEMALEIIHAVWPVPERHNRHNRKLWEIQQDYYQHIVALGQHYKNSQMADDYSNYYPPLKAPLKLAELLYNGAWYLYERGDFASASPLLQIAESYCLAHPTGADVILADIYGAFGARDSESNNPKSCLMNFEKQLHFLKIAFEKNQIQRPNVREALAYGSLANGYIGLNNYKDAEQYYRDCIKIWENCPGDSTIYIGHLGSCLNLQNKLAESERLLTETIREREARFGVRDTESFRTAILYLALGNNQILQRRFEEAFITHQYALQMWREVVGPSHHRFADCCYKVGWHFHRSREFEEARSLVQQSIDIYKTSPIYENESARSHFKLSEILAGLGDHSKSKEELDCAEKLRKKLSGNTWKAAASEKDFDLLVTAWSR